MQISERVYLVGSGRLGMQMTDPLDCNVFLLDGGSHWALIDAGSGLASEEIVDNIEAHGVAMEQVKTLLLTHIHGDHAAGAAFFSENYGIQVITAKEAAPWLSAGDTKKNSIDDAKKAGVYPKDFVFPACSVEQGVVEGDRIQVGDLTLQTIETPGHSRGHVSYLLEIGGERCLFSGDVVFADGKIVLQNTWDCSIQDYAESVRKLHELQIDRLYPGHGACLLSGARDHIQTAHDIFTQLGIPANL